VLPTFLAVFPRISVFCGFLFFFEDLRLARFWAGCDKNLLVFWACFVQIPFFKILWHFCSSIYCKENEIWWVCFCVNLLILGLFFQIFLPGFVYLHSGLYFFEFSDQTQVRLAFPLNYPFWACVLQIFLFLFTK